MVGFFYQKDTLNDTLLVNFSDNNVVETIKGDGFIVALDVAKVPCFINVFNFSVLCDAPNGFIEPTGKILRAISKKTKIKVQDFDYENKFVYGLVENAESIPETHLYKCVVNVGDAITLNIVCGAKNVRPGMTTIVAKNNAILPNGKRILAGKLMGYQSDGMLCSGRELNIVDNTDGIVDINYKVKIGSQFKAIYNGDQDAVL